MLARNNNGKYPAQQVHAVLKSGTPVPAHGNTKMPVWNTLFRSLNSAHDPDSVTELRIHNLVEYIQSIQRDNPLRWYPCTPPGREPGSFAGAEMQHFGAV
jgi:hypothetical protein